MYEGALAFEREILEVWCVIVALVSSEEGRSRGFAFTGVAVETLAHGSAQGPLNAHKVDISGVFFDRESPASRLPPPRCVVKGAAVVRVVSAC